MERIDQATLDLKFRLPDRALATVRTGDAITVSLPALATTRKATISIVAPSVDQRTRTVELTAMLDNRDGALRPGLMADVELASVIVGMLPVALGLGEGGAGRAPMALVVIGGLVTSTVLTLVVVPVVFSLIEALRERVRGRRPPAIPLATVVDGPTSS